MTKGRNSKPSNPMKQNTKKNTKNKSVLEGVSKAQLLTSGPILLSAADMARLLAWQTGEAQRLAEVERKIHIEIGKRRRRKTKRNGEPSVRFLESQRDVAKNMSQHAWGRASVYQEMVNALSK